MAYLDGYRFDFFVSYAHGDNHPDLFVDGWVNRLVRRLKAGFRHRGMPEVEIAYDARLDHNASIEELIDWARNSAFFVVIGSPTYVTRKWTIRELEAFTSIETDVHRFILVEMRPLNSGQSYPDPIASHNKLAFHRKNEIDGQIETYSPDRSEFERQADRLTDTLQRALLEVVAGGNARPGKSAFAQATVAAPVAAALPERTVLLAQQAGGLDAEHDAIRHYLQLEGIRVLPEFDYPQGAADFIEEFEKDAGQASIFVQLLGTRPGLRPRDVPDGYQALQLKLAQQAGIKVMQWRSPELGAEKIGDDRHRAIVFGPEVRAESFESFKSTIKSIALAPPPPERELRAGKALAFVNTHLDDIDFAQTIANALMIDGLAVHTPCFNDSAEKNLEELVAKLEESEALFFVYRRASQAWLHSQHRRYRKIANKRAKGSEPRVVAVCIGPPEKRETGIYDLELKQIDLTSGDLEPLHDVVKGLDW